LAQLQTVQFERYVGLVGTNIDMQNIIDKQKIGLGLCRNTCV